MSLPACGLYRTTVALGDHIPAGRLVYFHDHGEPGPGVYLPRAWMHNRAAWHERGHTVDERFAATLAPLPREGLYRVLRTFTCCAKRCRSFAPDLLVQLGYNGAAEPLLFVPEWTAGGLVMPESGSRLDADRLADLAPLTVAEPAPAAGMLH